MVAVEGALRMEDYAARLELAPEPRSASEARRWMVAVLDDISRPELAESASAGVSELVTNGILHAHTSISLVVQTFGDRVVVTVTDRSGVPTQTRLSPGSPRDDESTVGRGLRIVRAYATDWGITSSQHGKAIWFVPSETAHAVDLASFPDVELLGEEDSGEPLPAGPVERVVMLDTPVVVLRHFQDRWNELLREMHLVALGKPSALQALAEELVALVPLTRATRWLTPDSTADFVEAALTGVDRLDLTLAVPREAGRAFERVLEITQQLEDDAHQDLLLYITGGEQAHELRDWWFGEFARQLSGAAPRSWPGKFSVDAAWQVS